MQIDIRLLPFFEKPFKVVFPKLAKVLRQMSYLESREAEVSLYALVAYLERVRLDPGVPSEVKNDILPHLKRMIPLRDRAREYLLARKLNELDRILYQLEDIFEDLERNL